MASNFKSPYPCVCCGHDVDNEVTYHHEYGQKAYPEYVWTKWNLVSLCLKHHNELHNKGSVDTSNKYLNLKRWFIDNGWEILKLEHGMEKWIHDFDN